MQAAETFAMLSPSDPLRIGWVLYEKDGFDKHLRAVIRRTGKAIHAREDGRTTCDIPDSRPESAYREPFRLYFRSIGLRWGIINQVIFRL